jgi:S1-C subfamily serine protease
MRVQSILVGVLSLAIGASLGFAQPKAEKPADTAAAVNQNNQSPASEPGVLVVAVQSDSPAQKAGIVRGDIILAVNGNAVNTPAELLTAVEARKTGDSMTVKLRHGDTEKTMSVTLAERNGRPWMGTALYPAGRGRERELGDDRDFAFQFPFTGAQVTRVVAGSPAEKAGLKQGDVILSVDGTQVDPRHSLTDLIAAKKVGDVITLSVQSEAEGQSPAAREVKLTLEKSPTSNGPYAGVQYAAAPFRDGRMMPGAFGRAGVLVADVTKDGPASKAGIEARDIITKIEGVDVRDPQTLADAVAAHKPGDTLKVTIRRAREDTETSVTVTLAANPNDATKAIMGVTIRAFTALQGPAGPRGFGGMPRQRMMPPDRVPQGI